jgi:hypothetical protein
MVLHLQDKLPSSEQERHHVHHRTWHSKRQHKNMAQLFTLISQFSIMRGLLERHEHTGRHAVIAHERRLFWELVGRHFKVKQWSRGGSNP